MMQERERSRASASTISGKRSVRSLEPDAIAVLAGDDPEAVVLDLVQPQLARGRVRGFGRKAWRDEAERQGVRTRQHAA